MMQRPQLLLFHQRPKISKVIFSLQVIFALLVAFVSVTSLLRLYSSGLLFRDEVSYSNGGSSSMRSSNVVPPSDQVVSIMSKLAELEIRVKRRVEQRSSANADDVAALNLLLSDVLSSLDLVKTFLLRLKHSGIYVSDDDVHAGKKLSLVAQQVDEENETPDREKEADPLVDFFVIEEIRKYLRIKENRHKKRNFLGANSSIGAIGHACVSMKVELEEYMGYDVGDYCKDDWPLAQKLMVHGCDPLPRRRCLARAPPFYQKPLPINESLWNLPDDRNVRWAKYVCRSFQCLKNSTRRGFWKCADCFNLGEHEASRWVKNSTLDADFQIADVLSIKPGEIRIGLDFSVGVGTFAARMLEHNVTIVSSTLNLGAPFNEMIALRGLVPLYISINQRLPFFDNTLDILHSTLFLDGWIELQFLDFIIFDWDRVLRPGGLLWIDRFFCDKKDLDDYLYMFLQLRYKKHKWVIAPKLDKDHKEVYFSAVLEKPPRPF